MFDQYLRYRNIPLLELKQKGKKLEYRWITAIPNFEMPVEIMHNGNPIRLKVTNQWQVSNFKVKKMSDVTVSKDKFFVDVK